MTMSMRFMGMRSFGVISCLAIAPLYVALSGCGAEPPENNSEQQSLSEMATSTKLEIPPEKQKAMEEAAGKIRPGQPLPRHAPCGTTGPDRDHVIHPDAPVGDAVNQRNGTIALSPTNCPILGVLQPTDDAEYFCWTLGNDNFTWTFLRNTRTGVRGWSRDNLLDGFGAVCNCDGRPCSL
jgi:hypothetical protein